MPKPLFQADVEDFGGKESLSDAANTMHSTHYARIVEHEFNAVVIEHHLKWAPLCVSEPGPLPDATPSERLGRYDFYYADAMVDWCIHHNIRKIKGHVLVWHVTSPKFLEDLAPHLVREHVKRHIFTVMGHFRGRIQCWDVVNESLAPNGALAENVFYRKLGPSYIEDCFRWAHEADPDAILLYNDNKVEGIGSRKADAFYDLLADLKAKNVPIHGCGMQGHFNAAGTGVNRPPTPYQVKMQIQRLGELGLTVNLSELDVRISKLPDSASKDDAQRQIYHDILVAALTEPAFDGIWLWGFTDRHTWVHNFYYDDEPCIFDESYQRKEAYYAVRSALETLTPGHSVGGEGVLLHANKDDNGLAWGHEWMIPEDEATVAESGVVDETANDARPDWELRDSQDEIYDNADDDYDDADDDASGDGDASDGNDELLIVSSNKNLPPIS
jgi:endo-1,4-beta-xylanase